jgi:glycosyltransferase involved in cell wall biosynthesis
VLITGSVLGMKKGERVMWIYDTEAAEYLGAFKKDVVFYDCVDDHAAQAGPDRNAQRVVQEEGRILARADVVTTTSRQLYAQKRGKNKNTHLVLNAGDTQIFGRSVRKSSIPPSVADLKKPVIGSVGALDAYKVDFDLIRLVAQARPQWQFVLVGRPVLNRRDSALLRLKEMSNVHWLGAVDREDVPEYVAGFDVCMIPYRMNRYNKASFPLKFWEFMATGKPIVVTGLPELKEYNALIGYATNVKSFIAEVEKALKEDKAGSAERKVLARQHSWEKRAGELMRLMEGALVKLR